MAELWMLNKRRQLSVSEMEEMQQVLHLNFAYVWDMARLENLSLVASMTSDMNWQHDICREIDFIETDGIWEKPKKRKKPGSQGSTDQ